MSLTAANLRKWAVRAPLAVIGFLVTVIGGQWLVALAGENGVFQDPTKRAEFVIHWVDAVLASTAFHWLAGILLGASIGFAVGVKLDALVRLQEARAGRKAQSPAPSSTLDSLSNPLLGKRDPRDVPLVSSPIDPDVWQHVDPLTLRQAACLWEGIDPEYMTTQKLRGPAAARLLAMVQAVERGRLQVVQQEDSHRHWVGGKQDYARVPRMELARYANSIGEEPTFLVRDFAKAISDREHDFEPVAPPEPEPALWIEDCNFSYHNFSDGVLEKAFLSIAIENKTHRELQDIRIAISSMTTKDGSPIIPVHSNALAGPKNLGRSSRRTINMLTRNAAENGPWILHLDGANISLPMDEGITFNLTLSAKRENFTRTTLKVALRPGTVSDRKIMEQKVVSR